MSRNPLEWIWSIREHQKRMMERNTTGIHEGCFTPCAPSPNSVSSQADPAVDPDHYIAPFETGELSSKEARQKMLFVLENIRNCELMELQEDYLRVEFQSFLFGFIDDVEFYFPSGRNIVDVKSASRIGYSDMGSNRRRVEKLKKRFRCENDSSSWQPPECNPEQQGIF